MAKKQTTLEWTILSEDEANWADWQQRANVPSSELALPQAGWRKWQWWGLAAVLLVGLCGGAVVLWHQAEEGVAQIEAELYETARLEAWMDIHADNNTVSLLDEQIPKNWQQSVQKEEVHLLSALEERTAITVTDRVFGKEIVALQVVLSADRENTTYRQTRFYRHTDEGWRRTTPDLALWGSPRRLETVYFTLEYYQHDAQAVAAMAEQVDSLYATLLSNFGLPQEVAGRKLHVEVNLTQPPGRLPVRVNLDDPIVIPSPALYLAPDQLTDAELLMQALALRLIEYVSLQAQWHYRVPQEWPPVVSGLRLWQLWDLDLPLSVWQDEVIEWVYDDMHMTTSFGEPIAPPKHYVELCAAHQLWMQSPQLIRIPLHCEDTKGLESGLMRWNPLLDSVRTISWGIPTAYEIEFSTMHGMEHPGKVVALATIFEYAVVTYGRERLPALIAGFGTYESWDALLPVVLGVSAADFVRGWKMHLVERYGVTLAGEGGSK